VAESPDGLPIAGTLPAHPISEAWLEKQDPMRRALCNLSDGEIDDREACGFLLQRIASTGEPKPWPVLITRSPDLDEAPEVMITSD